MKHYLALITVIDETAPAGGIFKVEIIYAIRYSTLGKLNAKQD